MVEVTLGSTNSPVNNIEVICLKAGNKKAVAKKDQNAVAKKDQNIRGNR